MVYRDGGKGNGHYGFTVEGSGFRDIIPIMETQMEKEMSDADGTYCCTVIRLLLVIVYYSLFQVPT